MSPRPLSFILAAALVASVVAAGFGAAESRAADDATPVGLPAFAGVQDLEVEALVDHRQGVMRAVSGHMAASAAILLDGAPFEDRISVHGAALAGLLADVPSLFPEGSAHDESDARPEIWEDSGTFSERAQDTEQRAAAFGEATQGGNAMEMTQAFISLGDSCGACHDSFRF